VGYEQDFNLQLFQTILCVEMKYFSLMRYFLLLLVVWFYGMGISDFSDDAPHGIHFIRQTDGIAFIQHYLKSDDGLLSPGTLNLQSSGGKGACEFPLLYWVSAKCVDWLGHDTSILRLLHGCFAIIGLWSLFGLSAFFVSSLFLRLMLIITTMTCTVFNFYAFNFLPDMAALGMTLLGCYAWLHFFHRRDRWMLFLGTLAFSLAGLFKITFLIHPAALLLAFSVVHFRWTFRPFFMVAVVTITVVLGWWAFVVYYNQLSGDTYFTTASKSIWDATADQRYRVFLAITKHWRNSYFPKYTWYGLGAMILVIIYSWKSIAKSLRLWWLFLLIFGVTYALFFWQQLEHHDYYFLNVLPWFLLVWILFFQALENARWKPWLRYSMLLLLCAFTISSCLKAKDKFHFRLNEVTEEERPIARLKELIQHNRDVFDGIKSEKVWVIGDKTKNGSLTLINAFGYTQPEQFNTAFVEQLSPLEITKVILLSDDIEAVRQLGFAGWKIVVKDSLNQTMLFTQR
jgi:hypothetical protein